MQSVVSAIISGNKQVAAKSIWHMPLPPVNSDVGLPLYTKHMIWFVYHTKCIIVMITLVICSVATLLSACSHETDSSSEMPTELSPTVSCSPEVIVESSTKSVTQPNHIASPVSPSPTEVPSVTPVNPSPNLVSLVTPAPVESSANVETDAVVAFLDGNLEAVIRKAIEIPEGDIHPSDLEAITRLNARAKEITDLRGIEYCRNLTRLDLGDGLVPTSHTPKSSSDFVTKYNYISDLTPLSGLTNLTYLSLSANEVTDISVIAGLTSLLELHLSDNNITDLSPLASLPVLQTLSIASNNISDISPLSGITSLYSLGASDNSVSDLSPLTSIPSLTVLSLSNNQITDISPLSQAIRLERIVLDWNDVHDLSPLQTLMNLNWLSLVGNQIDNVSALSELNNLEWIELSWNNIQDLSALVANEGLSATNWVFLVGNPLGGKALLNDIPVLQERGVVVIIDSGSPA